MALRLALMENSYDKILNKLVETNALILYIYSLVYYFISYTVTTLHLNQIKIELIKQCHIKISKNFSHIT